MASQIPIPPNLPGALGVIWQQVAQALETGDTQQLQTAILDFINLPVQEQKFLEDMSTVIPYPGLPPLLISEIFANPEATIGVIDRLGPQSSGQELVAKLGTAEQAIVMDALISWAQNEQQINQDAKTENAAKEQAKQNPVNAALTHYVQSGGTLPAGLSLSSLQFLKTNPITLTGLQIADPTLLNEAYQMASGQLLLSVVSQIDQSPARQPDPANATQDPQQKYGASVEQKLRAAILKGIQDQAIPLNPQIFLVLWSLLTLPQTAALAPTKQNPTAIPLATTTATAATPTTTPLVALTSTTSTTPTPITAASATAKTEAAKAKNAAALPTAALLPTSPIIASWLSATPALFTAEGVQSGPGTTALTQQLGLLSYIYTQMAPYWMGPGAVSLMIASGGEATEASKTESSVRAFVIGLVALVNDPNFAVLITSIIKQNMPSASQEQLKAFIAALKCSILMMALVALYITLQRKISGQFNAQELKDMLLGKVPLPPDDLESGLIKTIQAELSDLPESMRDAFISNLLMPYNEFTDINELISPTLQFLNLVDPSLILSLSRYSKG